MAVARANERTGGRGKKRENRAGWLIDDVRGAERMRVIDACTCAGIPQLSGRLRLRFFPPLCTACKRDRSPGSTCTRRGASRCARTRKRNKVEKKKKEKSERGEKGSSIVLQLAVSRNGFTINDNRFKYQFSACIGRSEVSAPRAMESPRFDDRPFARFITGRALKRAPATAAERREAERPTGSCSRGRYVPLEARFTPSRAVV